jgi:hypothetical protein
MAPPNNQGSTPTRPCRTTLSRKSSLRFDRLRGSCSGVIRGEKDPKLIVFRRYIYVILYAAPSHPVCTKSGEGLYLEVVVVVAVVGLGVGMGGMGGTSFEARYRAWPAAALASTPAAIKHENKHR